MDNLGYILTGYAVTAGAIAAYRWQLNHRARRARVLITALSGRRPTARRSR
ncbi:MAG TPA: hypothetical protein VJ819_18435 [Nocardioidaceae bacterium]|nr:hypothetical protein [Nocardioidaceae bacterium]